MNQQDKTLASLIKSIDKSEAIGDLKKREVFDSIRAKITELSEVTKNSISDLMNNLEKDNTDIPEGATTEQIADFINEDKLKVEFQSFLELNIGNKLLPEGSDFKGLDMLMWGEYMSLIKIINSKSKDKKTDITNLLKDFKNAEGGVGEKLKTILPESVDLSKIVRFEKNMKFLKTNNNNIDFAKINVLQEIINLKIDLTESNSEKIIKKLEEKSSGENKSTQNLAIEKIINETNGVGQKELKSFFEIRDKSGEDLANSILAMENNSGMDFVSDFISGLLKKDGMIAKLITLLLGKNFVEAFSESNAKKKKSLLNLIKLTA